jgi:hypothetical protein
MADLIGIAVYLGVFSLICWAVYSFLPPSPPKAPKPVREPRYIAPRESIDDHLTRGLITILLLDLFCGRRDH